MSEDPFGPEAHDRHVPKHKGEWGHYCWEWDGLWICSECGEFECCSCWHEYWRDFDETNCNFGE